MENAPRLPRQPGVVSLRGLLGRWIWLCVRAHGPAVARWALATIAANYFEKLLA